VAARSPRRVPAAIRRRRLAALGCVAAFAGGLGVIVGAGGDDEPTSAGSQLPRQCRGNSPAQIRRLAGMRLMVRWDGERASDLERRVRGGLVGGVILFPTLDPATGAPDVAALRASTRRLQAIARRGHQPPLLVATDQEGGAVKRFPAGPPGQAPPDLDSPRASRREGAATARYLRGIGIDVDLAPVLDVARPGSIMTPRAFSSNPRTVARLGISFADGVQRGGVAATAKHFPGLGRSTVNTDISPSTIDASRAALSGDLRPFEAAVKAGVDLVMVGLAAYPAYGSTDPAALSPAIVNGLLRRRLGYDGVVITDDLDAGAIQAPSSQAAVQAARAGADILLFALDSDPTVVADLATAIRKGRIPLGEARGACARLVSLRESLRPR
jgi:beta-N-acetylhexosaminidase